MDSNKMKYNAKSIFLQNTNKQYNNNVRCDVEYDLVDEMRFSNFHIFNSRLVFYLLMNIVNC